MKISLLSFAGRLLGSFPRRGWSSSWIFYEIMVAIKQRDGCTDRRVAKNNRDGMVFFVLWMVLHSTSCTWLARFHVTGQPAVARDTGRQVAEQRPDGEFGKDPNTDRFVGSNCDARDSWMRLGRLAVNYIQEYYAECRAQAAHRFCISILMGVRPVDKQFKVVTCLIARRTGQQKFMSNAKWKEGVFFSGMSGVIVFGIMRANFGHRYCYWLIGLLELMSAGWFEWHVPVNVV